MRRNREKIAPDFFHIDGMATGSLNAICMEQDATLHANRADFFNRIDGAGFIIDIHNRYQPCLGGNRIFYALRKHFSVAMCRQIFNIKLVFYKRMSRFQNGIVFNGRNQNMRLSDTFKIFL